MKKGEGRHGWLLVEEWIMATNLDTGQEEHALWQ